ncbi:MAG: threonyl-tRNA synthetase [uncultured bacterium]|nr:MAG: threonyl-tRNA synthetase [uncultured bacterium]
MLPVSEKFAEYAKTVTAKLMENDIRVELSDRAESLGKRISEAEKQKTPYIIVIGERETNEKTVTVRVRAVKEQSTMGLDEFAEKIISEIKNKA